MATVPTRSEVCAGGVLWRPAENGDPEICLIATRRKTRWQLPKGHIDEGENAEQAAVREVLEETGCESEIEHDLGPIVFWFYAGWGEARHKVRKTVHFFRVRYTGGETSNHDQEVDEARWFSPDEALDRMSYRSEKRVLVRALRHLGYKSESTDNPRVAGVKG